jgi:hypothetical protein
VFGDSTPIVCAGRQFTDYRTVPVAIDLDLDGRKDLVLGEWYSSVRFYRNEGSDSAPLFLRYDTLVPADPDSFLNGNPPRLNFTDWDGDTDQDMITCDYYGSVFLRRNITPTGVAETMNDERGAMSAGRTIVRGVLLLPVHGDGRTANGELLDASGRKVLELRPGANDVSGLPPGVYFVREEPQATSLKPQAVRRVVLVR